MISVKVRKRKMNGTTRFGIEFPKGVFEALGWSPESKVNMTFDGVDKNGRKMVILTQA